MSDGTLYFENETQVALWNSEIMGQLSDGMWENTRPDDHWKAWCDCTAKVAEDGAVGRDFWVRKEGYALHSLIEYVGDRMLFYGNLMAQLESAPDCRLPDSQRDWEWTQEMACKDRPNSDYYLTQWVKLDDCGITDEVIAKAAEGRDYTMKDLRKDLTAMKRIMKTRLVEGIEAGW